MTRVLVVLLWATGLACVAIGVYHLLLGVASVPGAEAAGATVDSRERFYNAIFVGYGVAWILAARHRPGPSLPAVAALSGLLFLGGTGRLLSVAVHGWPHWFQIPLTVIELALPPLYVALAAATRRSGREGGAPSQPPLAGRDVDREGQPERDRERGG